MAKKKSSRSFLKPNFSFGNKGVGGQSQAQNSEKPKTKKGSSASKTVYKTQHKG